MSNFIDETERHAELYNAFTPRQRQLLSTLQSLRGRGVAAREVRSLLLGRVSDSERHWLERTGRIPGAAP